MIDTSPMKRDEWLAWRRHGIGASDVAAILGLSPWASPWSVWVDKVGLLPEKPASEIMEAGQWLELAIGPWFEDRTGLRVSTQQGRVTADANPAHRCTIDGEVYEGGAPPLERLLAADIVEVDPLGLIEIKTAQPGRAWDEIPPHYQCQVQWQLHCTGLDHAWVAVLMGRRLDVHELARDQGDIDLIVERVDAFWTQHVLTGDMPPVDGHDATLRAIADVYATPLADTDPEHVVALDGVEHLIEEWTQSKDIERAAEKVRKRAAADLQAELGNHLVGTVDGQPAVSWKPQVRRTTCKHCSVTDESEPFRVLRAHGEYR